MGATARAARRLGTGVPGAAGGHWRRATRAQRVAYAVGAALVAVGVCHLLLLLAAGAAWGGPVSWRKPATFGLSFGLTLATVTYATTHLTRAPRLAGGLLVVLAAACAGEVAAVTLQRWRGVPSHFNETTAFDAAVWSLMGVLIAVVALCVLALALVSLVDAGAPPTLRWGVRLALLGLLVGQAAGAAIVQNAETLPPADRFDGAAVRGAGGDLKLVHAVTLHAAQVVLGFAALASRVDWSERTRLRRLGVVAAGYVAVAVVVAAGAHAGRPPADVDPAAGLLLLGGLAAVGGAFTSLAGGVRTPSAQGGTGGAGGR